MNSFIPYIKSPTLQHDHMLDDLRLRFSTILFNSVMKLFIHYYAIEKSVAI